MTTQTIQPDNRVRLGYACINLSLRDNPPDGVSVNTNRTCRLGTAIRTGTSTGHPPGSVEYSAAIYNFLIDYGLRNTAAIIKIVEWHVLHKLGFYRLSSDIFPHIDNEKLRGHMTDQDIDKYRSLVAFKENLSKVAHLAYNNNIRITMHPSPYAVIASPDINKVHSTVTTLSWHAQIYEIMEASVAHLLPQGSSKRAFQDSILCLHIGGKYDKYGGKPESLKRWKNNFEKLLPDWVKKYIAIENCEKNFCVEDLFWLSDTLNIPIIFDFHHYNCYPDFHKNDPPQTPIFQLLPRIIESWARRDMIPKFHLSDQNWKKNRGAHHDFVSSIPSELLHLLSVQRDIKFDLMIEAKAKDYAVFYLLYKYPQFNTSTITNPFHHIPAIFHQTLPIENEIDLKKLPKIDCSIPIIK